VGRQYVQVVGKEARNPFYNDDGCLVPVGASVSNILLLTCLKSVLDRGKQSEYHRLDADSPRFGIQAVAVRMDDA